MNIKQMQRLLKLWCVPLLGVAASQETGSRLPNQDGRDSEGGCKLCTRSEEPTRRVHSNAGLRRGLQ